jgi:hypothetical protein
MENWKWLQDLIARLPEKLRVRRNLIDIAGYPSWENVNSNLLAFYFDKTEEHGFGTLFLDSLLELIPSLDSTIFLSELDFTVSREVRTKTAKRIDIVISQYNENENIGESGLYIKPSWSVIIENKVNHSLNNDLVEYWNTVTAKNKIGLVLSKYETDFPKNIQENLKEKGINYFHVSHKNLVNKVQEKLYQSFLNSDDRHLLFLKEFIANTQNYYNSDIMDRDNDKGLIEFHENKKNILALKKHDDDLLKFVSEIMFNEFDLYLFKPNSRTYSNGKHFYPSEMNILNDKVFRIYIDMNRLRYENSIRFVFELHGKQNTQYGSQIKKILRDKNIFTNKIKEGDGGSDKSNYQHIYFSNILLNDFTAIGFKEAVAISLGEHFWKHPNNFIIEIQDAFVVASNSI